MRTMTSIEVVQVVMSVAAMTCVGHVVAHIAVTVSAVTLILPVVRAILIAPERCLVEMAPGALKGKSIFVTE